MFQKFTYKGRYLPENPKKYAGDSSNIIYRSSWERRFMVYCDKTPSIISWASEELHVPYLSPIDKKMHRYYPDFIIKIKTDAGEKISMIEVKPNRETRPPRKKKNQKRYLQEIKTWGVNEAKWRAAKKYCELKGWDFKIITEKHLLST
jgi:hypothetical protein